MTLASDIAQIAADTVIFHDVVNGDASETVMTESGAVDTLAAAISKIGAVNYRGDWAAVTAYAIGDAVAWSSALYRCIIAHTSGDNVVLGPTQDAADWVVQNAQPANVTNAQMANMGEATVKGRAAGAGTGKPKDLTGAQVAAIVAPSLLTGMKNRLINGNFDVWQRGSSVSAAAGNIVYTSDRWFVYNAASALSVSRVTASTAGARYAAKVQRVAGQTGTATIQFAQVIESADSIRLAGKNVSFSFTVKKGANYSGGSITCQVISGTGVDQGSSQAIAGWTGEAVVATANVTPSVIATKYTITGSVPANSAEVWVRLYFTPTGTAGADDSITIEQVQLEEGSVATPFEQRPIGLETVLAMRYFQRYNGHVSSSPIAQGFNYTSINARYPFRIPRMRIAPAVSFSAPSTFYCQDATITQAPTGISAGTGITPDSIYITATVSGRVAGQGSALLDTASSTVSLDAEV